MAWKNVFDDNNLLSQKEVALADKFVKKGDNNNALFFKRNFVYSTIKYEAYSGVACPLDWDEITYYTVPRKCFLIIDKETNKIIAFTEKLDKNKDSIVSILEKPFELKDIMCPDVKNMNGIYNINKESIIPVKKRLQYDQEGNIFSEELITVTKKTYFLNGVAQAPKYSGHEDIVR